MAIFTINIYGQSEPGRWPIHAEYEAPHAQRQSATRDELTLSDSDFEHLNELGSTPVEYGTFLGKRVFNASIVDLLRHALQDSSKANLTRQNSGGDSKIETLHIILYLDPRDQKLNSLHWEWLSAFDSGSWRFLGLRHDTPISQYVQTNVQDSLEPLGRHEQRALILVACPHNQEYFSVKDTVDYCTEIMSNLKCEYSILASKKEAHNAAGPPSMQALLECLRDAENSYTILHIVCHGKRINNETLLYFADQYNQPEEVSSNILIDRLSAFKKENTTIYISGCL